MESDLNVFYLPDELLLDFEPGLTERFRGDWKNILWRTMCRSWMSRPTTGC